MPPVVVQSIVSVASFTAKFVNSGNGYPRRADCPSKFLSGRGPKCGKGRGPYSCEVLEFDLCFLLCRMQLPGEDNWPPIPKLDLMFEWLRRIQAPCFTPLSPRAVGYFSFYCCQVLSQRRTRAAIDCAATMSFKTVGTSKPNCSRLRKSVAKPGWISFEP